MRSGVIFLPPASVISFAWLGLTIPCPTAQSCMSFAPALEIAGLVDTDEYARTHHNSKPPRFDVCPSVLLRFPRVSYFVQVQFWELRLPNPWHVTLVPPHQTGVVCPRAQ